MNEIILSGPGASLDLSCPADASSRDRSEVLFRIFEALGDIRVSMVRIESKVDRIDDRVATLDQRIDRLDQRFDRLDQRFGRLERQMEGIEVDMTAIGGKVARVYWGAAVSVGMIGLTASLLWWGLQSWTSQG